MASRPRPRVLAVYRHPTPYRDPLMDRVAAIGSLDLHVAYLDRTFEQTPWELPDRTHDHSFPRGFFRGKAAGLGIGFHPSLLWRWLRDRPDACVLSGWIDPTVLAIAALCRLSGTPYILGAETFAASGHAGAPRRLRDAVVTRAVAGARAWLPTGTRVREYLVGLGADASRCHFYPTSPDARRWERMADDRKAARAALRSKRGLPDDGVVAFVGRLVPEKAVDVLLDARQVLLERGRDVTLVIAGDGPERARLEGHPAARGAHFLGFVQPADLPDFYAAADVFVLPSRFEPWGAVAVEAMASGLPAILSDAAGTAPELVADGLAGEMVAAGDAIALADALERVLDRPDRRTVTSENARARARAWGHDLNLRSLLRALGDCGIDIGERGRRVAHAELDAVPALA